MARDKIIKHSIIMACANIQSVQTFDGRIILAIIWVDQIRRGAYMFENTILQLICTDEETTPAVASSIGIGPSFQMVRELHKTLNNMQEPSDKDKDKHELYDGAKAWLKNIMGHWFRCGYELEWLHSIRYSQVGPFPSLPSVSGPLQSTEYLNETASCTAHLAV
jgi:hypothetical protein